MRICLPRQDNNVRAVRSRSSGGGRMNLNNTSRYPSIALKHAIRHVCDKIGYDDTGLTVNARHVRRRNNYRHVHGYAFYHRKAITLFLLREKQNAAQLFNTIEHELYHTLGLKHKDMHIRLKNCGITNTGFPDFEDVWLTQFPENDTVRTQEYLCANGSIIKVVEKMSHYRKIPKWVQQ